MWLLLLPQVFRMSSDSIGCSLAEAAESDDYTSYLTEAAHTPRSLHVVYINTSLRTKATAHSLVPTITCTSSNVVQTVLQGFAQVGVGRPQQPLGRLVCMPPRAVSLTSLGFGPLSSTSMGLLGLDPCAGCVSCLVRAGT